MSSSSLLIGCFVLQGRKIVVQYRLQMTFFI